MISLFKGLHKRRLRHAQLAHHCGTILPRGLQTHVIIFIDFMLPILPEAAHSDLRITTSSIFDLCQNQLMDFKNCDFFVSLFIDYDNLHFVNWILYLADRASRYLNDKKDD